MGHTAFSGFEHIASGTLPEVYAACSGIPGALIYDDQTGRVVDVDPRHPPTEERGGPGRPKLGVVAREVTLMPRHWEWLAAQPGGASVALRKVVEEARKRPGALKPVLRNAAFRFATTVVGDAPGYEEAMRALFSGHREEFLALIEAWPADVRAHLEKMTAEAF